MPRKIAPSVGLSWGWERGEDFWGGPENDNLVSIDTLLFPIVQSLTFTTPPANSTEGQQFIVAQGGAGVWAGQDGNFAFKIEGAWKFITPKKGWRIRAESYNAFLWFDGTNWLNEVDGTNPVDPGGGGETKPTAYDIGVTVTDDLNPDEPFVHLPVLDPMILQGNMAGSQLDMIDKSPGYAQMRVQRNGQNVGAVTVEAGAYSATFTTTGGNAVSFAKGDRLTVRAPAATVAGFKNFGFVIRLKIV